MKSKSKSLQLKLGGLSCSFCASSIETAFQGKRGVKKVSVSLAHKEMLAQYDPEKISEKKIKETIRQLGYKIRDPDKVEAFEEEEQELKEKSKKLSIAAAFTAVSLLSRILMWVGIMHPAYPWVVLGLALITVFGPGLFILNMAFQSLRRGILNQYVLLEFGAFAGLGGGITGFFIEDFPVVEFFGYLCLLLHTTSFLISRR